MQCKICEDKDFVLYYKRIEKFDADYEYIAHCTCPKGEKYKSPRNSRGYYVASVEDVFGGNGINPFAKNVETAEINDVSQRIIDIAEKAAI